MNDFFIAFHGKNGIGKTTQAQRITLWLEELGFTAQYIKFPVYDGTQCPDTGPLCDAYAHQDNPNKLSPLEWQELCVANRREHFRLLEKAMKEGIVVAESSWLAKYAYGRAAGLFEDEIPTECVIQEDISFLLTGKSFLTMPDVLHGLETDQKFQDRVEEEYKRIFTLYPPGNIIDVTGMSEEIIEKRIQEVVKKKIEEVKGYKIS